MSDKQDFDKLMKQYSSEAQHQAAVEEAQRKKRARWGAVKAALGTLVVLAACGALIYKNDAIRDKLGLGKRSESEYRRIMNLSAGSGGPGGGSNAVPLDPNSREAKLKALMENANARTAIADDIIDNGFETKPKTNSAAAMAITNQLPPVAAPH